MQKQLLTHKELLEKYRFIVGSRNTIYKFLREEDCPSIKIKGKWFVYDDEFYKWYKLKCLEEQRKNKKKS